MAAKQLPSLRCGDAPFSAMPVSSPVARAIGFFKLDSCFGGCFNGLSPARSRRRTGIDASPTTIVVTPPTEARIKQAYAVHPVLRRRSESECYFSCRSQETDDESTDARSSVLPAIAASSEAPSDEQQRSRLQSEGLATAPLDVLDPAAEPSQPSKRNDRPDWWADADLTALPEGLAPMSKLLEARVIAHGARIWGPLPWTEGESSDLYEAMGMRDPSKRYVAIWNRMGDRSVLIVSEVINEERFEDFSSVDFLMKRLKLIMNPVKVKIPFIMKGPKSAETVGEFFGRSNLHSHRAKTAKGVDYVSIHIDLHSKWILKMALQTVAFRLGNVVDLDYVDWDGQAVVAALRLQMTNEGLELLS
eukprot:TRINITY_DN32797_c0_g1_i1.p1 TRINITY_DN32797_c0_g1~~TRINITY_DN32797_c0_g1_i1.p1  ORF type:complete len:395 (-),score=87.73 TRINITY_DN32797_c0_g1_i1:140-1222(-)